MAAAASTQAQALISGTTGAVNDFFNPPPNGTSLLEGNSESNEFIRAFDEKQGLSGFEPFRVDVIDISNGNLIDSTSSLSPGMIMSGAINTHLLHFDPIQELLGSPLTLTGQISFAEDIVGIAVLSDSLDDSDIFGLDTVIYPTGEIDQTPNGPRNRRGLGFGEVDEDFTEFVSIVDSNTLAVEFTALKSIDQIRVITSLNPPQMEIQPIAVPEPSSVLGLLLFGALGTGGTLLANKKKEHLG